jgi:hypothetical protein
MNNTGGNLPLLVDPVNQATELRYPKQFTYFLNQG